MLDFKKTNYILKKELNLMQPYDIAEFFPDLEALEQQRVFELIGIKKMAQVFSRLTEYNQVEVYEDLDVNKQRQILNNLEIDELKEFIDYHDEENQEKILSLVKTEKANLIKDLLIYSNETAPSIMSTEFMKIKSTNTVKEATSYIFNNVKDDDFIDNIYVVNDEEKLVGVINLKELIIARSTDTIKSIMTNDFIFAYNDHTIKEAIEIVRNYDITAIPVIDHSEKLLGIITADDVLEQLINQYDETYNKLAYIKYHDESYTGLQRSLKRLPWLVIATILNLIIAAILASVPAFEATVSTIVILVLFQPMILDMAGNVGTQNLAVTILGLHKEELDTKEKTRTFIKKEIVVSTLNSFIVAIIGFVLAGFFTYFNKNHGTMNEALKMGTVVGGSLFVGMGLSGILGTMIPLWLEGANINPDNASGPILTTLNDIIALFTYYGIAALLLMTF